MKNLSQLASAVPGARVIGSDAAVSGVRFDSRQVQPGDLFVAMRGIPLPGREPLDGHEFLPMAIEKGAAAVVIEADRVSPLESLDIPKLAVADARASLGAISSAYFDEPSKSLFVAGVTGTNGKTTTTQMIDAIARTAGDITGVIGTIGVTINGASEETPGDRTTPEAPDLQELLARVVAAGGKSAAMEVASNALTSGRVSGIAYDVAVFTNLTQDHLDVHGTMENYRDAKGMLFREWADAARAAGKHFTAVINVDDAYGPYYANATHAERLLTYSPGGKNRADIVAEDLELAVDSLSFTARTPIGDIPIRLPFGGTFQAANALGAVGYGVARGLSPETIASGLANCPPVPGRFEPVKAGQDFAILVDYAHTPDGIENVLKAARPLTSGRLICVFGCGGDRDNTKRPKMGRLAELFSDIAIVTSDNPRTEDPERIIDMVLRGMEGDQPCEVRKETDRRKAIALAISLGQPGDTIVIAGKGHEDYQILGTQKIHFSDVEVATEEVKARA
ncbi:MAG: UDP-N-acetylmuramoyl-L-alanyl-D-glutamate--2,6-diaminopimelate ligase [Armatimonas sp.]